jgi:hypothetical protein
MISQVNQAESPIQVLKHYQPIWLRVGDGIKRVFDFVRRMDLQIGAQ